ncbi:MAG: hypothetical protein AB1631_33050 [Acidobacteriota bacterium]
MDITISLTEETGKRLADRAAREGKGVADLVAEIAEREAHMPTSLRDLFAPVREQIKASGVSDQELAEEIESAIAEVRQARKNQRD